MGRDRRMGHSCYSFYACDIEPTWPPSLRLVSGSRSVGRWGGLVTGVPSSSAKASETTLAEVIPMAKGT